MSRQTTSVNGTVSVSRQVSGNVIGGRGGTKEVYSDTTAGWNAKTGLIAKKDCLYIYTDYAMDGETPIASMKVGTGNAYLADLPFIYSGKVTDEMIAFWNDKVTAFLDPEDDENLVLNKD